MQAFARKAGFIAISVGLAILIAWLLTRNLEFSKIWAFGDLIAFPSDLKNTSNLTFFAWSQEGMGFPSLKPFNYYLTTLVTSGLLGSNIAQKTIFLCAIPLAFGASLFLMKRIGLKALPSALGALIYAFNPLTVSETIGGSITLIVYAIFPVVFWFIYKILFFVKYNRKDLLILGLASFAVFNLHAAFWYVLLLVPMFVVAFIYRAIEPKRLVRFIIPLVITALVLAPNIVGYVGVYSNNVGDIRVSSDTLYCYSDADVLNVIRLAGNKGSAQAQEYLNYNTLNSGTVFGYSIIFIGAFALLGPNGDGKSKRRVLIYGLLAALIVLVGAIQILKNFPDITDLNSILSSLRNPGKLLYPLALTLSILFAFGLQAVLTRLTQRKQPLLTALLCLILVGSIFIYNSPAISGDLGIEKVRGESYYVEDKYSTLSSILYSLDHSYGEYKVLFMPWDYSTLLKVASGVPNYFGMPLGGGVTADTKWLGDVLQIVTAKNSPDRSNLLALFGVKYVIIDKTFGEGSYTRISQNQSLSNVYSSYGSYWIAGEPQYFYKVVSGDSDFTLKFENRDIAIFQNKNAVPLVYSRTSNTSLATIDSYSENLLNGFSIEACIRQQSWPRELVTLTNSNTICLGGQQQWWTNFYLRVPVEEGGKYKLGFSVQAYNITDLHAKILWFDTIQNRTESKAFQVDYLTIYNDPNLSEGEWLNIQKIFVAPKDALSAWIWFGASRLENYATTLSYFSNITFQESFFNIKDTSIFSINPDVTFKQLSLTEFSAEINVTSQSVLVLSESYNPSWVCYVNSRRIEPFCLYGAVNGYIIDEVGVCSVTLLYEPQNTYRVAYMLSIFSVVATCMLLLFLFFRNIGYRVKGTIAFPPNRYS